MTAHVVKRKVEKLEPETTVPELLDHGHAHAHPWPHTLDLDIQRSLKLREVPPATRAEMAVGFITRYLRGDLDVATT